MIKQIFAVGKSKCFSLKYKEQKDNAIISDISDTILNIFLKIVSDLILSPPHIL